MKEKSEAVAGGNTPSLNKKEIMFKALPSMLFSFFMIAILMILKLSFVYVIIIILSLNLVKYTHKTLYKKEKQFKIKELISSFLKTSLFLAAIFLYFRYTKAWGFCSLLLFCLIFAGYILYAGKTMLMNGIRSIETQIWGKPLDEIKRNGEKPRKIKLVWRKKKHGKNRNS